MAMISKKMHSYQLLIPKQFQLVEVECFEVMMDRIVLLCYIDLHNLIKLKEKKTHVQMSFFSL